MRDLSDALVGWTGTLTDIHDHVGESSRPAAGVDFAELRLELERANQELQQFAYAASHDMREPVRMVTSYLNLLERRYVDQLDQTANDYIKFAVEGSTRMGRLIDDLLAYSRVVGAESLTPRPVNMNGVMQWVAMNLAKEISEAGAKFTWEELPTVNADENRIVMVVQHLVSNSLKFRGEAPPEVRVTAQEADGEWIFTITDNGLGFDQQYAERVFGVFKRLHGKQFPGTGMGLAIAKKVVERHGGRIWAESAVGQGARFYFTLPF
jgi:light-regulated signal transduction histidine kinase (bacteriophytochrome)